MFRVEFIIKDVNYDEIADKVIPIVIKKYSDKGDKSSKVARILAGMKGLPAKLAKAALAVLPQQTKDEMTVHFITEFKEDIISSINSVVKENGIAVKVEDMKIEKL